MTPEPAEDRQRRILVVRCPAWPAPSECQETPEARAFEQIANAIQEFCPRLEVLRPGICAFSERGVAGYFGGEAELAGRIIDTIRQLGFDCGIGIADGLFAALLASRDTLIAE